MNASKILQVILFIISNWATVSKFFSELLKLFADDKAKINECLNGICNAAQTLPPGTKKETQTLPSKRVKLIGYILSKIRNKDKLG